jgi:hypothetical protein
VAVVVGISLIPAGAAFAQNVGTASAKSEKKQNQRIARQAKSIKKVAKATTKVATAVSALSTKVTDQGAQIDAVKAGVDGINAQIAAIVPAVTKALTDLQAGLLQLKAGLETAGAGLTSLKTLATSQEYGFGQLLTSTGGPPTAEAGSFVVTPDIPDAVQQAQTTQQFVAQHNGVLIVAYGVRSNETDGTGASNPAALCKVTVTNEGGTTETTAPNGAIGGLPFQPVPNKSAMTSTTTANAGFPFGLKTDNTASDADQTVTFASTVAVATGDTYTVGLSCVDTSPSASDPSA